MFWKSVLIYNFLCSVVMKTSWNCYFVRAWYLKKLESFLRPQSFIFHGKINYILFSFTMRTLLFHQNMLCFRRICYLEVMQTNHLDLSNFQLFEVFRVLLGTTWSIHFRTLLLSTSKHLYIKCWLNSPFSTNVKSHFNESLNSH